MMKPERAEKIVGLVLPGGGARGAYQAGVLKAVGELAGNRRNPFPVIAGVSAGSINGAALAAGAQTFARTTRRLAALWEGLHTGDVYYADWSAVSANSARWAMMLAMGGMGSSNPLSLLDNRPLRDLLLSQLDLSRINRAISNGALRGVGITASGYSCASAVTFFEGHPDIDNWHRSRRGGVRERLTASHIVASAALPFVFPAQRIGDEFFGDGSLRLRAPLSPAIRMGAERILVIGARDNVEPPAPLADEHYPSLGHISGYMLDVMMMDNLDADIERLQRINETLSLLPKKERTKTQLRQVDVLTILPSRDLRDVAREHGHEMPASIRFLLRGLGVWGNDWRLPSYLLFEPGFLGALIELGYADAMAREDELHRFLWPSPMHAEAGERLGQTTASNKMQ